MKMCDFSQLSERHGFPERRIGPSIVISNALWLGTPIKALLDEVQPLPDADQVVQRSVGAL